MKEIFVLPSRLFTMVDPLLFGVNYERGIEGPVFVTGNKYFLQVPFSEKGRDKKKVYELIGIVNNIHGIDVDSLIMRQVSGERGTIFSLSKSDCAFIGIPYEEGLQLFPMSMGWKELNEEERKFNPDDISTTRLSGIDRTVRNVLIQVGGFSDYVNGYAVTPNGKLVRENEIYKRLKVTSNVQLLYGIDNTTIEANKKLVTRLETPSGNGLFFPYGNCIGSDGNIYISISFIKNRHGLTSDGKIGIAPRFLEGLDPRELLTVSFDETGLRTVDDYVSRRMSRGMITSAMTWQNEIDASDWDELNKYLRTVHFTI